MYTPNSPSDQQYRNQQPFISSTPSSTPVMVQPDLVPHHSPIPLPASSPLHRCHTADGPLMSNPANVRHPEPPDRHRPATTGHIAPQWHQHVPPNYYPPPPDWAVPPRASYPYPPHPTGPNTLPSAHSRQAPERFEGHYHQVEEFLEEVDALYQNHRVFDPYDQVRAFLRYCSLSVKEFVRTSRHYKAPNWPLLKQDLITYYDAELCRNPYRPADLEEFIRKNAHKDISNLHRWRKYYVNYNRIAGHLLDKGYITERDRHGCFWKGIPSLLKQVLESRLLALHPRYDSSHPWEMDDVCQVAESHFNRAKFEDTLMPFFDDPSRQNLRISQTLKDSSDEDSEVSEDSDSENDRRSTRQHWKKQHLRRSKDIPAASDPNTAGKILPSFLKVPSSSPSPSSTRRNTDNGQEIENLIHELSRLDISDPNYAGKYYRAARLDALAVKYLPEPANRQRTAPVPRYNPPMQSWIPTHPSYPQPSMPAPAPAPVPVAMPALPPVATYPNTVPLGSALGPRPYDNRCFGCNDANHQIGNCPATRQYIQQGVISRDPITRRFSFWNGESIWKRRGETLVDAVSRYLATVGYPPAQSAASQSNYFRLLSPSPQEEYWDANYVDLPEEEECFMFEYESDEQGEGPYWHYYTTQAESAVDQLFLPASATQVATVSDSEVTDEDELESNFPAAYPATRQPQGDKIMTRARQAAAQAPLGKDTRLRITPPATVPAHSKRRPPPKPIPEALPPPQPMNLPDIPIPVDARQPRTVQTAPDIEMVPPLPAPRSYEDPQHNLDGQERTRFPRQSELSAQVDPRAVANKILDQSVQLPLRDVLGTSRELSNVFQDSLRIKTFKPPKEAVHVTSLPSRQMVPQPRMPQPLNTIPGPKPTQHTHHSKQVPYWAVDPQTSMRSHEVVVPVELNTERQALLYLPVSFVSKGKTQLVDAIIDTGSEINIMHQDTVNHLGLGYHLHESVMGNASGGKSALYGRAYDVQFQLGGGVETRATLMIGESVAFSMLLGQPWIINNRVTIDQRSTGTFLVFKDDSYHPYAEIAVKTFPRPAHKVGYTTLSITRPDSPMDWTPTPFSPPVNLPSTSTIHSSLFSPIAEGYGFVSFGPTQTDPHHQPQQQFGVCKLSSTNSLTTGQEIFPQPMDIDYPQPKPASSHSKEAGIGLAPKNTRAPSHWDTVKGRMQKKSVLLEAMEVEFTPPVVPTQSIWKNVPMPRRNGVNPSRIEQTSLRGQGARIDPVTQPPDRIGNGTGPFDRNPKPSRNRPTESANETAPQFTPHIAQNPRHLGQMNNRRGEIESFQLNSESGIPRSLRLPAPRQSAPSRLTTEEAMPTMDEGIIIQSESERRRLEGQTTSRTNRTNTEPSTPPSPPPPPYLRRMNTTEHPDTPPISLFTQLNPTPILRPRMALSHVHTLHRHAIPPERSPLEVPGSRPEETLHSASISLNTTVGFVLPPANDNEDPTRAFARVIMPVTTMVVAQGDEIHSVTGQMYGCFHYKSSDFRMEPICQLCHTVVPTPTSPSHHDDNLTAPSPPLLASTWVGQDIARQATAIHGEVEHIGTLVQGAERVEDVTPSSVCSSPSDSPPRSPALPRKHQPATQDHSQQPFFHQSDAAKNYYALSATGYPVSGQPRSGSFQDVPPSAFQSVPTCVNNLLSQGDLRAAHNHEPELNQETTGRKSCPATTNHENDGKDCKCDNTVWDMREPYQQHVDVLERARPLPDLDWDSCGSSSDDEPGDVEMSPPLDERKCGEGSGEWVSRYAPQFSTLRRTLALFTKANKSGPAPRVELSTYACSSPMESRPRTPETLTSLVPPLPRPRSAPIIVSSDLRDYSTLGPLHTSNPLIGSFAVSRLGSRFNDNGNDDNIDNWSTASTAATSRAYARHSTRNSSKPRPHPLATFQGQSKDWDQYIVSTVNPREDFSREEQSFLNELQADCAPWIQHGRYAVSIPTDLLLGAHLDFTQQGRHIHLRLPLLDNLFTRAYSSNADSYSPAPPAAASDSSDNEYSRFEESSDDGHEELSALRLLSPPSLPTLHDEPIRVFSATDGRAAPPLFFNNVTGEDPFSAHGHSRLSSQGSTEHSDGLTSCAEGSDPHDGNGQGWKRFSWEVAQDVNGNTETWTVGARRTMGTQTDTDTPLAVMLTQEMETEDESDAEDDAQTPDTPINEQYVPPPPRTRSLQRLMDALAQLDTQVGNLERLKVEQTRFATFRSRERAWERMVNDRDLSRIVYWENDTNVTHFELDNRLCRLNNDEANPWIQHGVQVRLFRQAVNDVLFASETYLASCGFPQGIREAHPLLPGSLYPYTPLLLKHETRYFYAIIKYFQGQRLHHYATTFQRTLRSKVSEPQCLSDLIQVVLTKTVRPFYHLDPVDPPMDHQYQD